jgi:DNA-binding NarL/FixJ family response regulator
MITEIDCGFRYVLREWSTPLGPRSTVILVEDDELVRGAIASAMAGFPDMDLTGQTASARGARALLAESPVHLAIVDLNLTDGKAHGLIAEMTERAVQVLVLTVHHDDDSIFEALRAGAGGYLLKQESNHALGSALRLLRDGGAPISPRIARRLLDDFRAPFRGRGDPAVALTPRERELVELFAKGLTYGEVADILGLSVNTVRSHVRNLYEKLQVTSKAEAVARVMNRA